MLLEKNDTIRFTGTKEYLLEKFIRQGRTWRTSLIRDDILNTYLVCKKYEPVV